MQTSGICTTQYLSRKTRCKKSLYYWYTNRSPKLSQTNRPYNSKKKKKQQLKTCRIMYFPTLADNKVKLKETMEHKSDGDTNSNRCTRYSHRNIGKKTGRIRYKNARGDHSNDITFKMGQNIEKNPWVSRRLAVTQTPVKNHYLMLMWKILKGVK